MCKLNKHITDKKEVIGYKVVAKRDNNEYYSIAIGFKYRQPIMSFGKRTVQKPIGNFFSLLKKYDKYYNSNLVGRTAAFCDLDDAKEMKKNQRHSYANIVVVKVRLTNRLMSGTYPRSAFDFRPDPKVVAGHTMEILEEI